MSGRREKGGFIQIGVGVCQFWASAFWVGVQKRGYWVLWGRANPSSSGSGHPREAMAQLTRSGTSL